MLKATFRFDPKVLQSSLVRYSGVSGRGLRATFLRFTRGVIKRSMGITPPANSLGELGTARGEGGGLTSSDLVRGQSAISRDLARVFCAVELQHLRKEATPDVVAKHRERFIASKKPGDPLTRGRVQPYYVDKAKLKSLQRSLELRAGKLASGWLSAAQSLGVTGTPAWVSRHGTSRGNHRLVMELFNFRLTAWNNTVPDELVGELDRRLEYALGYATNAIQRETEHILAKGARDSGFDTR